MTECTSDEDSKKTVSGNITLHISITYITIWKRGKKISFICFWANEVKHVIYVRLIVSHMLTSDSESIQFPSIAYWSLGKCLSLLVHMCEEVKIKRLWMTYNSFVWWLGRAKCKRGVMTHICVGVINHIYVLAFLDVHVFMLQHMWIRILWSWWI